VGLISSPHPLRHPSRFGLVGSLNRGCGAEQALLSKTARLVKEVALDKIGTDHIETVHEKLRRQQAEVERIDGTGEPVRATRPSRLGACPAIRGSPYQVTALG
jgi:hypothetical protein